MIYITTAIAVILVGSAVYFMMKQYPPTLNTYRLKELRERYPIKIYRHAGNGTREYRVYKKTTGFIRGRASTIKEAKNLQRLNILDDIEWTKTLDEEEIKKLENRENSV